MRVLSVDAEQLWALAREFLDRQVAAWNRDCPGQMMEVRLEPLVSDNRFRGDIGTALPWFHLEYARSTIRTENMGRGHPASAMLPVDSSKWPAIFEFVLSCTLLTQKQQCRLRGWRADPCSRHHHLVPAPSGEDETMRKPSVDAEVLWLRASNFLDKQVEEWNKDNPDREMKLSNRTYYRNKPVSLHLSGGLHFTLGPSGHGSERALAGGLTCTQALPLDEAEWQGTFDYILSHVLLTARLRGRLSAPSLGEVDYLSTHYRFLKEETERVESELRKLGATDNELAEALVD